MSYTLVVAGAACCIAHELHAGAAMIVTGLLIWLFQQMMRSFG